MSLEITRHEYERSIGRVRGTRDRAYQSARVSGIMFAIFGTVTIFTRSKGGVIQAFTFITGFAILAVFGIVLPVIYAYMYRKPPRELSMYALELAGLEIADDLLYILMILCTHQNRETVRGFDWLMKWVVAPGVSLGVLMILAAVVWLYL